MTRVFSDKLDAMSGTLDAVFQADHTNLARMLSQCAGVPVYAVGSGGSVIVAELLSQCRSQLGHSMTSCITPMAYVLGAADEAAGSWFFSASGNNQDIQGAFEAGLRSPRDRLFVLTNSVNGALASLARDNGAFLNVSPVADPKDGFLATHSAISGSLALVLASDQLSGHHDRPGRLELLRGNVMRWLASQARLDLQDELKGVLDCDTLMILHDPQLSAGATLIETSAWEAGLCSVQRTDFRNFAHGRHVWLDKHPRRTLVLSLITEHSAPTWNVTDALLPDSVARKAFSFGRAGRAAQLEAVAFGLSFIEALGIAKSIDPGKPGVADFGRKMFDDASLREIVAKDVLSTRRKRRATIQGDCEPSLSDLAESRARFIKGMEASAFGGIVLDYDGTVVATDKRLEPPDPEIAQHLMRLIDGGVQVGFASGRGGSIGEMLRTVLPEGYHSKVLIGYYNGALIEPLKTDIQASNIEADSAIAEARRRLVALAGLFRDGWVPKEHRLQLTIDRSKLTDAFRGPSWMVEALAGLKVQVLQSGHSVDIFPAWASKRHVVARIQKSLPVSASAVLCIGDRGERFGNDHDLLEGPHGLSVGKVCDRPHTCWNLAPDERQGPLGLQSILKALKVVSPGAAKLSVPETFSFG